MDSKKTLTLMMCIAVCPPLYNLSSDLEPGQLIKINSCTCPEDIITYECRIDGSEPGGYTIWNGTALNFNCGQQSIIILRHSSFSDTNGASEICDDGTISGRSLGVSEGNIYTSQLQVNVTNSTRSQLIGRTVQCVYSPNGSTYIVIGSQTITITDSLPPPDDIQLTQVKRNELTFSWSSVEPNCSTLQYALQSNCGMCTHNPDIPTSDSAMCSFEVSAISSGICYFAVQTIVCGNTTGRLSSSVQVTLRVPASPTIQGVIPTYSIERKFISIEVNFTNMDSFNISNMVDGSALYYNVNFIDTSVGVVCNSSNVSASSCSQHICMVPPVQLTRCSQTGNINVTVSAVNLIGEGPDSSISIARTNQYIDVRFESMDGIVCTFHEQQDKLNLAKSCDLVYGPCQQNKNFKTTIQGTPISSKSPNVIIIINLSAQIASSGDCYVINADNGTFITRIEGIFDANGGQRNTNTALTISITVILLIVAITVVAAIIFLIWKQPRKSRKKTITSDSAVEAGQIQGLVVSQQIGAACTCDEYEFFSAHIFFNIKNKLEDFIEALKQLSDIVNIENIKISPFKHSDSESDDFDESDVNSEKMVCIECDHNLTEEQTIQIEALSNLGVPRTKKINSATASEQIAKKEKLSDSVIQTITVDLQHKKGALCGLLQTVQSTEGCQNINIIDIIHQTVEGKGDRRRVTVEILSNLPEGWRKQFDINKSRCEYILPVEGETYSI